MTLVLAHRGSGPAGPERENTVPAFLASRRLGADGVELDVRRSADGRLVVHHDARLADGRLLCELAGPEVPSFVPSLEEVLESCRGMLVNVEVKNAPDDADFDPTEGVARATGELLSIRVGDRVVVSAFSLESLAALSEVAPGLPTAWLVARVPAPTELVASAVAARVQGVHPFDSLVGAGLVDEAHDSGLAVRVWTIDAAERARELVRMGVDALITNDVATIGVAVRQVASQASRHGRSMPPRGLDGPSVG